MKKYLLLLLFIPLMTFGQELNMKAQMFKSQKSSTMFNNLEQFAKDKWGDDNEKVVRTINKQAEALYEYMMLPASSDFNMKFYKLSVEYNRFNKDDSYDVKSAFDVLDCCIVNWVEALQEYNELIEKLYY